MALIVQKYGGTSVGDTVRIRAVAQRVKTCVEEGNQVVVVVSARSGVTNELVARAKDFGSIINEREMDMLLVAGEQETIALTAMALQSMGVKAVSRTGAAAGILTDSAHTKARITKLTNGDIKERLAEGNVVVVAGFQGADENGEITTLGRGGSDLSAVALAAGLKADVCQIYTDVEGIYTADPRIVRYAKKINEMAYDELLELASSGSKVMQARSVEFARKHNVVFEVRSSFNNKSGTIVKSEVSSMENIVVSGIAVDKNQVKVTLVGLNDEPGAAAEVFEHLAIANITVDMIVQNVAHGGKANLTFTVARDDAENAKRVLDSAQGSLKDAYVDSISEIAKVSAVGIGMKSHSGIASTFFGSLARAGINIELITTSEIKISVGIDLSRADEAVNILHSAFDLDEVVTD